MRPVDRDVFLRPAIGTAAGVGRLTGQGRDGLHRSAGPDTGLGHPNDPRVLHELEPGAGPPPVLPWPDTSGELGTEPAQRLDAGHRSWRPRPGWYAYRVTGAAELPSWAVEIALTIERPVASSVEAPAGGPAGGGPAGGGPTAGSSAAEGPAAAGLAASGPAGGGVAGGGSAAGPAGGGVAGGGPAPELGPTGGPAQALVLLRAPGRLRWLDGIAEAIAEVETIAGIRPAGPEDDLVAEMGGRRGRRRRTGPALPGLAPVTPAVARAHLRIAGSRGLPAPLRRRRPATAEVELAWRAGAGCVLTCDGPDGRSAQAVVGLRGMGNAAAVAPPPGGALVLRAWRASGGCGVACGLVLGASATLGLGREARRVAAVARRGGWDASVLTGSAAMHLAQAGDPRRPAPGDAAQAATTTQLAAMFEACLNAADLAEAPMPTFVGALDVSVSNANHPAGPGSWR